MQSANPGEPIEYESCSPGECPAWTDWTPWSSCTATCGGGKRKRLRQVKLTFCLHIFKWRILIIFKQKISLLQCFHESLFFLVGSSFSPSDFKEQIQKTCKCGTHAAGVEAAVREESEGRSRGVVGYKDASALQIWMLNWRMSYYNKWYTFHLIFNAKHLYNQLFPTLILLLSKSFAPSQPHEGPESKCISHLIFNVPSQESSMQNHAI